MVDRFDSAFVAGRDPGVTVLPSPFGAVPVAVRRAFASGSTGTASD